MLHALRQRMRDDVVIYLTSAIQQATNEYGDEDATASDYYEAQPMVKAYVVPVSSTEDEVDRETLSRQWDVYLEPTVEIEGTSLVDLYVGTDQERQTRVLGEPQTWPAPNGGQSHKVARVEAISG